jgi:hypothetical protein
VRSISIGALGVFAVLFCDTKSAMLVCCHIREHLINAMIIIAGGGGSHKD